MKHLSRSTLRPPAQFLLLLALLLPLLAACGGSAPAANNSGLGAAPTAAAPAEQPHAPPASAATAAPAAEVAAPVISVPGKGEPASGDATRNSEVGAPAGGAIGPLPQITPIAPPELSPNNQQGTPLKAGEVDDNADFAQYLEYLRSYSGPPAHQADVSERYILTVVNEQQQPVLDARVRLFDAQQLVFEGRTYAGGKTIFFPRAVGLSSNTNTLRMQVEKGNSVAEGQLKRGQDGEQTIVLRGAAALPQKPRLDVLFLLDATGSMGDEISQIQNTIASIAERVDGIEPRPDLRFGLVAYRDRGDEYVTRVYDFTPDVAQFQQLLASVRADGGGDTPESLNEGLHNAIQSVGWADDAVRLAFLVADAPPHLDYPQDYDYIKEARVAVSKGIKIYTIAASNTEDDAEYIFRQLAQQTMGHFIFLTYQPGQNAGTPGETTTHQVDPEAFTVERLDDLVVQVIQHELALAQGAS
jgi:Mg-chelatase subunit ChlD